MFTLEHACYTSITSPPPQLILVDELKNDYRNPMDFAKVMNRVRTCVLLVRDGGVRFHKRVCGHRVGFLGLLVLIV